LFTPTVVADVHCTVFSGFCRPISVYPHDISKTDAARVTQLDIEMFHDEFLKTGLFWGQKVKGQGHELQQVCVGLQTERNIVADCIYVSRTDFSPLQRPAAQAMLATSGFPCVTSPRTSRPPDFPCVEVAVSQQQKHYRLGS